MNLLKWWKDLRRIVACYDIEKQLAIRRMAAAENATGQLRRQIASLEALIRDRTNIAVDVGFKTASHVIVIGRYRNADYVQSYSLSTDDLGHLIEHLKAMDKTGQVRRVDAIPSFKAVYERELKQF